MGELGLVDQVKQRLEGLYAKIPKVKNCKTGCSDCCGPVPWSIVEAARAGSGPHLPAAGCMDCPHSTPRGCNIYTDRPLMCRLFATVKDPMLTCPHGASAIPEEILTVEQGNAIIDDYINIRMAEEPLRVTAEQEMASLKARRKR